jgi:RHS repeat-associated protein
MNPQPSVNNYRFTGYERDGAPGESGNDNSVFRSHIARLGRFNRPDPIAGSIADPQSLNRYAYVANDPVNATDPLGLFPFSVITRSITLNWGPGPNNGGWGTWTSPIPLPTPTTFPQQNPFLYCQFLPAGFCNFTYALTPPTVPGQQPGMSWGPPGHDKILEESLKGCATPEDIAALKKAGREFDMRTQRPANSPLHSMQGPGQSPEQAIAVRDGFVSATMAQAVAAQQAGHHGEAMTLLAGALHAPMDSTSRLHTHSDGSPQEWSGLLPWGWLHSPNDSWGVETSKMIDMGYPRFGELSGELLEAYKAVMGGCPAAQRIP